MTKIKRFMGIILSAATVFSVITIMFLNQPAFGKKPNGERLERIKQSPNYRDGKFQNISPTVRNTSGKSQFKLLVEELFTKRPKNVRPNTSLPTVKTDLKRFERNEEVLVWMGHSSLFIQTDGKRLLIDPVLVQASPVSFFNKPFKGTNIYTPDDMPDIDYFIITHDHWDHLDYHTVKHLKNRTATVICPLGVGEHLEHWGFDKKRIIEMDWNENTVLDAGFTIHCLPARHSSGRGLTAGNTLWASFMLQTSKKNIFISGDSGYDTHFADIGKQFEKIDLAILENGQYNKNWRNIHLLPQDLVMAAKDINAKKLVTMHNSKYAMSRHSWKEPLDNIAEAAGKNALNLLTPMIGEPVYLNDTTQIFEKWWKNIK
jgi:L-ascorbate metabolism protein UlaG (beta-lactamase superfamily)